MDDAQECPEDNEIALEHLQELKKDLEKGLQKLKDEDRECRYSAYASSLALQGLYLLHLLVGVYRNYFGVYDNGADTVTIFVFLLVLLVMRQPLASDYRSFSYSLTLYVLSQLYVYIVLQGRMGCLLEHVAVVAVELLLTLDLFRFGGHNSVSAKGLYSMQLLNVSTAMFSLQRKIQALRSTQRGSSRSSTARASQPQQAQQQKTS